MDWWGLWKLEAGPVFQKYKLVDWIWMSWEAAVVLDRGLMTANTGERIADTDSRFLRRPGEL